MAAPARPPPPTVSQQMEQIDQQIVALLQDIDEAFSNLHQTVATRLIPAVKRFNHHAEPTREFAKFWRQFFELAANTRVPDAFSYNEHPSRTSSHDDAADDGFAGEDGRSRLESGGGGGRGAAREPAVHDDEVDEDEHTIRLGGGARDDELTRGESSFMAGLEGLGSSTPLVARRHGPPGGTTTAVDETAQTMGEVVIDDDEQEEDGYLLESPVDQLGRALRSSAVNNNPGRSGPPPVLADNDQGRSESFGLSLPSGVHPPQSHHHSQGQGKPQPPTQQQQREPWEDDDDLDSPDASFAEAYSLDEYAAYQDQRAAAAVAQAQTGGGSTPKAPTLATASSRIGAPSALAGGPTKPSRLPSRPAAAGLSSAYAPPTSTSSHRVAGPHLSRLQPTTSTATPNKTYTGLTNLSKTPLSTSKSTGLRTFGYASSRASSADSDSDDDDDDDSFGAGGGRGGADFLPPGMSPPVTMNFTLPPARGAGRLVVDRRPDAEEVVQGAVRTVEGQRTDPWMSSAAAAVVGAGGASVVPPLANASAGADDLDEDEDEDEDSFDQTFHGGSTASLAPPPGSSTSQHSYHSHQPSSSVSSAHDHSFDSDSDSSSSSSSGGANDGDDDHDDVNGPPGPSYALSSGHASFAPSPGYPPLTGSNNHSSSRSSSSGPSYPPAHPNHQLLPPDVSSISFNPNLTANDSLFVPLPPIPYPAGYGGLSPAATSARDDDDDDDTLASMDDPFNHHQQHGRPGAGGSRAGFGLYGTEGEMYTFNGGRLEDAAPTESPTPYVPEPKRY